jgi:hypothetical protein
MGRSILVTVLAAIAGLLGLQPSASAQQANQPNIPPLVGVEPPPKSASPNGAAYIPGVGFRYVVPGGAKVYGYTAYGPRVYGYRARANRRACRERDWWGFERCGHRWW